MPRIEWGAPGKRFYEAGVDRGVLYVGALPGVPWNGLTGVNVSSTGGEAKPYYLDGVKYLNISSAEEFQATITAYTYPDEFAVCDGTARVRPGLYLTQQRRKSFGLSYRTMVGNDQSADHGYKVHLVYNALAGPSDVDYRTIGESTEPGDFSWTITTRPPAMAGYSHTSHIVFDSRDTDPVTMAAIEDILYGTSLHDARLPEFAELVTLYDAVEEFEVIDNGDGTFTVIGPDSTINMLSDDIFQLTRDTVVVLDDDTYTISS
jgi:hypothetical protein